LIKESIHS